ncbi:MAG: hypothetical protein KU37_11300 [Sulfuricurvum sp. PC08-66]|nr:MAG: hypothetical protein KU37_11300 [Sulfuricurvum sp. PC08-66]
MAKKKNALGRGLSELFGEITQSYENEIPTEHETSSIPIVEIRPNPYQPRKHFNEVSLKELAHSIREHGLLQPIVVTREMDGYILVAGERRLRASKIADLTHIKATILAVDNTKLHEMALIENIQREELNPIELAKSYQMLLDDHNLTHDELSQRLQKSRAQITNTLRLLALDEEVQEALVDGRITQGHAKVLLGVDAVDQRKIVASIVGQKLSVRDVEELAKGYKKSNQLPKKEAVKTQKNLEFSQLLKHFEALNFSPKAHKNVLSIEFHDQDEIDALVESLTFNKDLFNR